MLMQPTNNPTFPLSDNPTILLSDYPTIQPSHHPTIQLIDTHCHMHEMVQSLTPIYDKWFADKAERTPDGVLAAAHAAGVHRLICIGTTLADSELAVEFAAVYGEVFASIGIHPHEAKDHLRSETWARFTALAMQPKVVAVGECGLDYYYNLSPKADQEKLLRFQIELALEYDLPLSFHVRDAFDDFWPIVDSYSGVRGVLHSFTDSLENLEKAVERGLFIGVNGIATFTKNDEQLELYRTIPQQSLLLETDAPYLTPAPHRGKVCEPKHVRATAEFLSELRGVPLAELATATTANAVRLFKLS